MTQSSLQLRSARPFTVYIRVGILLTGRTHLHDCTISLWTHTCSLTRPLLVDLACSVADDWVVVGEFELLLWYLTCFVISSIQVLLYLIVEYHQLILS